MVNRREEIASSLELVTTDDAGTETFARSKKCVSVFLKIGNTTAVGYINNAQRSSFKTVHLSDLTNMHVVPREN